MKEDSEIIELDQLVQLPDPKLVEYYDNLKERVFWITSDINSDILDLVKQIIHWNYTDKGIPYDKRIPIKLIIRSDGGSLEYSNIVAQAISLSTTPVYGYAIGGVSSGASVIYLSCHKRFAWKNVWFCFHKGFAQDISGNYNDIMAWAKDYHEQITNFLEIYKKNTKYTSEEIEQNMNNDWYIYCDEAVEKGIVHKIMENFDELFLED